jgi:hypothetical protein
MAKNIFKRSFVKILLASFLFFLVVGQNIVSPVGGQYVVSPSGSSVERDSSGPRDSAYSSAVKESRFAEIGTQLKVAENQILLSALVLVLGEFVGWMKSPASDKNSDSLIARLEGLLDGSTLEGPSVSSAKKKLRELKEVIKNKNGSFWRIAKGCLLVVIVFNLCKVCKDLSEEELTDIPSKMVDASKNMWTAIKGSWDNKEAVLAQDVSSPPPAEE